MPSESRWPGSCDLTTTRPHPASRALPFSDALSAAQRAAVGSDARLVVAQGGPGAGKTEAAVARVVRLTTLFRQDPAWILVLVASEPTAAAFRARLARALGMTGCPQSTLARAAERVVPMATLHASGVGGDGDGLPVELATMPQVWERVAAAADELAPSLGLSGHLGEARALIVDAVRFLSHEHKAGPRAVSAPRSDGDWFRRGVGLVEESVRSAQVEVVRRLRTLDGASGRLGDLGRRLRRPSDVSARARELRSAVERAWRFPSSDRAELERLRGWLDVAAIDLAEATRREAPAAAARRRLIDLASTILAQLQLSGGGADGPPPGASVDLSPGLATRLLGATRHVIIDDAHDLAHGALEELRRAAPQATLFVTGDQRSAEQRGNGHMGFRALLREAGRAVVLLEAPRFGAGVGRFVNALGARLWPPTEPGGYAPAISRLDSDAAAAAAVELWLVRRRTTTGPGGSDHPEPIADARGREAQAVAAGVRRMLGSGRLADATVLVQDEGARSLFASALEAEGVGAELVKVRTVDQAAGLEWCTVFVTGLDAPLGGPAPRRAWMDPETGLAVVWPVDEMGRRTWPFSSLLLAQRAAVARDSAARQRLFLAVSRARTRLVLTGVTRDRVAGGDTCVAPVEWLRRQLGITDLGSAQRHCRIGEANVGVWVVDVEAPEPA
jgi:hypothetical protein